MTISRRPFLSRRGLPLAPALLACALALPAPVARAEDAPVPANAAPGTGGAMGPPGEAKSARTEVLEAGARALQSDAPVARLDLHLTGLHPMKEHPGHQMVAHHFCQQVNEDFAQCVLFDSDDARARLIGIEYIISATLFEKLPEEERGYWHPHNYEILSGQLLAPGLPDVAETAFMRQKMNSYGKTWHVWDTGSLGSAGALLPLGAPMLAWSFNRDGEAAPALLADYERRQRVKLADKQRRREELRALARPQEGTDALQDGQGRAPGGPRGR